jgi:hypothetical protein
MDEILNFLLHQASFLYKEFGFRFVDSQVSKSFGGDAFLVLATEKLRFRLVRDRGQLFGDFQDAAYSSKNEWFSIDIVRKRVTGEADYFPELNSDNAAFLRNHFGAIEKLFDKATLVETRKQLHKLETERARKLFG